ISPSIEPLDFAQHTTNVSVVSARLEYMIAFPGVTPLQDLDCHASYTPLIHLHSRGTVQINRIPTGKSPAVIVHLIELASRENDELCACRPARPVRRGASYRAASKGRADSAGIGVPYMITLSIIVCGCPDFHKLAPFERRLILGE